MQEALCWSSLDNHSIRCQLCRHGCVLAEGGRGICKVRENRGGKLFSLSSGRIIAEQIDPIEKKPLYHLLPGSRCYSLASVGCNFHCLHCQNHEIAQYTPPVSGSTPGRIIAPQEAVQQAMHNGCRSIAFTYTEPTVWFEYTLDTARLAAEAGLYTVYVTNGYISDTALSMLAPFLHAANIDLKGFSEEFYKRVCGASLNQVLDSIRTYRQHGIWIEITTLLIPGENDDPLQLNRLARFIADELGPDTPWHISRFFPRHRMLSHRATPVESFDRALEAGARAGLRYIYEGNIANGREQTRCPGCGALLIGRNGYAITKLNITDGSCPECGRQIAGIWG